MPCRLYQPWLLNQWKKHPYRITSYNVCYTKLLRIEITLENGVLTLKGERSVEGGTNGKEYRRKERVNGTFMRQFTLPETVDTQNISATVKNGVLDVVIPKQAKPQPTRITIN